MYIFFEIPRVEAALSNYTHQLSRLFQNEQDKKHRNRSPSCTWLLRLLTL